jgi:hypothetical protein
MLDSAEFREILRRCAELAPARDDYRINDYVTNLLLTVLDFQLKTEIVKKAHDFYHKHRRLEVRTHEQLQRLLSQYPDDKDGNTALAIHLWGYRYWNRAGLLRKLVGYFQAIGVTTQEDLSAWAATSEFSRDFQGRIPGLSYAVYNWLVMRQGIETIKPDIHVRRFVESIIGRRMADAELVSTLEQVAIQLGLKAYELDWRIWESQRDKSA